MQKFVVALLEDGLMGPRASVLSQHRTLRKARESAKAATKAGYHTRIWGKSTDRQGRPVYKRVAVRAKRRR